jgi:glutathione S-transferase
MLLEKLEGAFSILDRFLEGQTWIAGNNITIADYSIVATVATIDVRPLKNLCSLHRIHVHNGNWQFMSVRPYTSCLKSGNYFD